MSEAIIRTLRRDDYPALIDLVRRTWYAEFDERTGLLAAEADWENCLARTTNAFVAELDGQPVALIVGRVDALDHRSPLNSHRINSWNALARLVFAKGGIKAAGEILGILGIDKRLRAQAASAGHDYARKWCCSYLTRRRAATAGPAHVRDADGRVPPGRRARLLPVSPDTTCDVGFYVHRGLTQVCEQSLPASVPGENPSSFYLYEGSVPEPA